MTLIHKEITISGVVQGVGFRYACLKTAQNIGIKGFVKNKLNGDVYIDFNLWKCFIHSTLKSVRASFHKDHHPIEFPEAIHEFPFNVSLFV